MSKAHRRDFVEWYVNSVAVCIVSQDCNGGTSPSPGGGVGVGVVEDSLGVFLVNFLQMAKMPRAINGAENKVAIQVNTLKAAQQVFNLVLFSALFLSSDHELR